MKALFSPIVRLVSMVREWWTWRRKMKRLRDEDPFIYK